MKKKKIPVIALCMALTGASIAGCGGSQTAESTTAAATEAQTTTAAAATEAETTTAAETEKETQATAETPSADGAINLNTWLQNEIHRLYLIAANCHLCHMCDKHNQNLRISAPDLLRHGHPVFLRHINIQTEQFILLPILRQEFTARIKSLDGIRLLQFQGCKLQEIAELLHFFPVVIHNRNSNHFRISPHSLSIAA